MSSFGQLVFALLFIFKLSASIPISNGTTEIVPTPTASTSNTEHEDEYIGPILICRNRTDDGLNKCLERILKDLTPRLAGGIPEIGLQPLDPFHLDKLDFKTGRGSASIKAHFSNMTIRHLASFKKAIFKISTKERLLRFDLAIPKARIDGTYDLGGNILFFPIAGTGPYFFDIDGLEVKGVCNVEIVESQNGSKILQVDKLKLDVSIHDVKIELMNLFNGNRLLGPAINAALNENSQELFQEIKPDITGVITGIVTSIANAIISHMPFLVEFIEDA